MSSYIPQLQTSEASPSAEPRVVALQGSEVDGIFDTLSSETRRNILKELYEAPSTPSELAAATETSLQNVHYHVEKLAAVDLIESIDTRYSEKGKEMSVYAPKNDPLIFVESEETRSQVESSLERLVGVLSLLAISSLVVQKIADVIRSPEPKAESFTAETVDTTARSESLDLAPDLVSQFQSALLEPASLVFIGGIVALVGFVAIRRMTR